MQREGIFTSLDDSLQENREMRARDLQSEGYLKHSKFPTQISYLQEWIYALPSTLRPFPVLDLGCGPGPSTVLLVENGFSPIAVDFSFNSLLINKAACKEKGGNALFLQEDLNKISFNSQSAGAVIVADVLQHLGSQPNRVRFLANVLQALVPGGKVFLSFFNLNLKNYWKGDVHGEFSEGIAYERLHAKNVLGYLPEEMEVERMFAMNIVNHPFGDRLLARLPLAWLFSRMIVIQGKKRN